MKVLDLGEMKEKIIKAQLFKKKKSAVSENFFAAESDLGIEIIHAATVKPWLIWTFIYSHHNRG
jgi:hypothetical protein